MNFRLLSMAGLVALTSAFVVAGCGDDDTTNNPPAGGSGGASAGKAGGAGKGGMTGTAGKPAGGSGNTAGEGDAGEPNEPGGAGSGGAPSAGSGGTTAGAGGTVAGAGGTSGSAGKSGSGGAGGATAGAGGATAGAGGATAGAGGATAGAGGATAGAGGATAGAGGATAGAGGAAAGAGGASAGAGGAAAGAGGSGGQTTATGCEKFTIPYSAASQVGTFGNLSLGGVFDFSSATISSKIYIQQQGSAASLQYLLEWTNASSVTCTAYVGQSNISAALTSGFGAYTLVISLTSVPDNTVGYCNGTATPLDRTKIKSIGIQFNGSAATPTSTAIAWLDSITITGASPTIAPFNFDTAAAFSVYTYNGPTPAASYTWQATCP